MDSILRLFYDHPIVTALAGFCVLLVTVVPFAGKRFPGLLMRVAVTLGYAVVVPFGFWKRTVHMLAFGSGGSYPQASGSVSRRLIPVFQGLLIFGGLFILTAGAVSGWHASGVLRETGQLKAALRSELPELEQTLTETRAKIADLDREWEGSRECLREESFTRLVAGAGSIRNENAVLAGYLANDQQTKQVFRVLKDDPGAEWNGGDLTRDPRAALPSLGLPREKEWLLARYLQNSVRETKFIDSITGLNDASVRQIHQPEIETLRKIEAEIPPAIARVRADLAAPDPGRTFDVAAFVGSSVPSLFLFCGFVWVVGGTIEWMGSGVILRRKPYAIVNEKGQLNWAE